MSTAEAAELIGVTVRRVQALIGEGRLAATRVGSRTFVLSRKDVEAFARVDRPPGRPPAAKRKPRK